MSVQLERIDGFFEIVAKNDLKKMRSQIKIANTAYQSSMLKILDTLVCAVSYINEKVYQNIGANLVNAKSSQNPQKKATALTLQ